MAQRFFKAFRFSALLMGSFILVSGIWNAFRIGVREVLANLSNSLVPFALYTILIMALMWGVLELKERYFGG